MIDLEERFWSKVLFGDGCWEWTAGKNNYGYGRLSIEDKMQGAHRVSWMLTHGEMPELYVLHHCDNRSCVRPDHLFLGTQTDNMRDRDAKGRHGNSNKTHCKRGHEFTVENTYIPPTGERNCRKCKRMNGKLRYQTIKGEECDSSTDSEA